jgi:Raf kinase inhibitor-like YbhB/YbcL family protein
MPANPIGRALRNRRAGHHTLAWARPELAAPENLTLTSPAFDHETPMPERFKGKLFGPNPSPALEWTAPPAGTAELVLIAEDPDVPFSKAGTHLLARGLAPTLSGVPENGLTKAEPVDGVVFGKGAFGHLGWAGPMPPRSHGPHAYVFQLFAVDQPLSLETGFSKDELVAALAGHVLGRARLDGIFEVV